MLRLKIEECVSETVADRRTNSFVGHFLVIGLKLLEPFPRGASWSSPGAAAKSSIRFPFLST